MTGGTINGTGSFIMQAERLGAATVLAQIVAMVAAARQSRAPIQGLADRVAAIFVPTVVVMAVLDFAAWMIWGPDPSLLYAVAAAVSVLIIACPCALGLATPISIVTATGRGAQINMLIKGGEVLEQMAAVDTLVVDKIGTLTMRKPALTDASSDAVLGLAAPVGAGSGHPPAAVVLDGAWARGPSGAAVSDFVALPGKGVQGMVAGHRIALGIAAMLADFGLHEPAVEALRNAGKTVMFVPRDVAFAGLVAAADTVKPGAAAVKALQAAGLRVIMATGDALATAGFVARLVGIGKVHAALLPEAKKDLMDLMHAKGARVAMAGDGVNDAPALATADVGLAMGHGADLAVQSAGMTLLSGDLAGIRRGHRLARVTLTNIRQNLVFAFAYHAIGIPIAAAAMSLSSVSVITNALRLRWLTL